ncbi:MAG: type II/IV secretion system protein [Finegoldia magna]|uniref:GspE/PulE family protein n=1 Tax=Finegoldia magna TaxID=1260 RepID=UPI0026ED63AA|nr:GspE/PulE family protein [Finegoldia magna]MBS5966635.1 type II/IV secretion system protein [Finegoldia magna]
MEINDNILFVNSIIDDAIRKNSSDIHIEPFEENVRIRFRINGSLVEYKTVDKSMHSKIITRIKIMSELDIAEKRLPQDGRITYTYENSKIDLRISIINTIHGQKCVIRILNPESFKIGMQNLGISEDEQQMIEGFTKFENGMVLICGPTGSGKTTTLYTMLEHENTIDKNIITIENPVEYNIFGINQIQINEKIGLRFDNTLKFVLRQDPSVIMVGEIRDLETAKLAIRASITGHKVYSTIHTDDCYQSIIRLMDMGIEDYMIRASLKVVIAQRLVRKLCPHCKKKVTPTPSQMEVFRSNGLNPTEIYEPGSCDECSSGYDGRMAVMQILKIDDDLRSLIKKDMNLKSLKNYGEENNIDSLFKKALIQVALGNTSFDEAMRLYNED